MKVNRDEVDTIPICFNESGLTEWILFCKEKKKWGGGAVAVGYSQKILFSFWLDQAEHISRTEIIFFFFSDVETPCDLESILIFCKKSNF